MVWWRIFFFFPFLFFYFYTVWSSFFPCQSRIFISILNWTTKIWCFFSLSSLLLLKISHLTIAGTNGRLLNFAIIVIVFRNVKWRKCFGRKKKLIKCPKVGNNCYFPIYRKKKKNNIIIALKRALVLICTHPIGDRSHIYIY